MTGYYAQIQFGKTHAPCTRPPFTHVDTETNCCCSAATNCLKEIISARRRRTETSHHQQLPTISRRSSPQEEEEQRTIATTQQPTTISRRSYPSEVQPLTIYPQQPYTTLFKMLGKRPKKLEKPHVKPTYQRKTQSYHQCICMTNESD